MENLHSKAFFRWRGLAYLNAGVRSRVWPEYAIHLSPGARGALQLSEEFTEYGLAAEKSPKSAPETLPFTL